MLHPQHESIDRDVVDYLVDSWEWPSERTKKGFISWNLSDVVLFMFPTGNTIRVKLACELLLLGFLLDGESQPSIELVIYLHSSFVRLV
jgi:hypothetical protein